MIIVTSSFSKTELRNFQNVFRPHKNIKSAFSDSSGLKSVFEKLRFRDGLVWTVGLTVEIKLRFQISPALCGRSLRLMPIVFNLPILVCSCSVYNVCLFHQHPQ